MIERKFVAQKFKEFQIEEFISQNLKHVGHSHTKMVRTPLGEKITIYSSRPGLIVGMKGQNIKKLTKMLKNKFKLENPQIEINEVADIFLDAQIVAERIANSLERFGTAKFKGIGHKILADVINAGAKGIEVIISGKIPGSRAKSWRFYQGYLKKCGDIAVSKVKKAYAIAQLKTGIVGIQVRIMTPEIELPDNIIFKKDLEIIAEAAEKTIEPEEKPKKRKAKENAEGSEAEEGKKPRKQRKMKTEATKENASEQVVAEKTEKIKEVTEGVEEAAEEKTAEQREQ